MASTGNTSMMIGEMREFAGLTAAEQRYIKCSLDIGLARGDAFEHWARSGDENASIRRQHDVYAELNDVRCIVPDHSDHSDVEHFIGKLVTFAVFDLGQEQIESFSAFRFLYERLLGAGVRPYLPAVFCAASALPAIAPQRRKLLLQSLSEAAATAPGWSNREPTFFPEFVEEAEAA